MTLISFLIIDDVIIAEWEQNEPSLLRESLSKILERIWDKKSYCTNGKCKVKGKYWEQNIDHFIEYRKAKLEHICPYQILEKIDMYSIMNYIIDLIDDGFITKDDLYFNLKIY